ncbi:MAG TPA: DUF3224 domain-containing protein [Thermoanaerobaculia bacterium]|nr:DUF3224 domain-containing protein [Thermoanaerobaculia bacterium]
MKTIVLVTAVLMLATGFGTETNATPKKETPTMPKASGTFDVDVKPDPAGAEFGRMTIDKQFHGDLEGTSKGEMLSAFGSVEGSGVYVAVERVTATLHGRKGTFVLHHSGVMNRGQQTHNVEVVPDSGTGELQGLTGTMKIIIAEGKHSYEFDYTLAP